MKILFIIGSLVFTGAVLALPSFSADPVAGFICNAQTRECFLDVIKSEDGGDILYPGCSTRPFDDMTGLREEGFVFIEGNDLRKRQTQDPGYSFCGDGALVAAEPEDASPALAQQIEGFNLVGYGEGGEKAWDVKGDRADIVGDQVALTNVDANSYGEQDMNLKARKGTIDKITGNVDLEQDVVITAQTGAQMKTDTLQWRRDADLVETEDLVTIEDKDMIIVGKGFEAHPSLKEARLKAAVTADIETVPPEGKGKNRIQITCDGPMELDQVRQVAVFRDNVVAIELDSGRKLVSDVMDVRFDPRTRKIQEIVCTGNVELHQDGNVTHSEALVYRAEDQRVTLTGRPKLIIDSGDVNTQSFLSN
ncbi:MAG: LPS export ABC transporter periplasmic protein LptC [Elusimicrobia bacterium]|nr:LPS export ABC transporter periplasmic protein LptC [Elusimicrobiota bacterium]